MSSEVDLSDTDHVLESGAMLKALANNRHFLVERVNEELLSWRNFQTGNNYSAQTLALGGGNGFYVRANMWLPPSEVSGPKIWESNLYAYTRPHDHNFSFLTVGYFGSGYATSIYEYDPEQIAGIPGEQVQLRFLEKTTLPAGKVMFYRAGRDVHSQEHPEEFSISLNLMLARPEVDWSNQYWFDLDRYIIQDFVQRPSTSGRVALCRLAGALGNGATINILESIASHHEMPRVRASAYESLAALTSSAAQTIWEQAIQDRHPFVRDVARRVVDEIVS
jgi:HEAT repeats